MKHQVIEKIRESLTKKTGILNTSIYSIKDLESLTGIKAHTIRMWEQRYGIVEPKRTSTNIRYYDAEDLKLMLKVALLNQNGYRISKIAKLSAVELSKAAEETLDKSGDNHSQIKALTVSMLDLDEESFERVIQFNVQQVGFEATMLNIIYPFLMQVGILWTTDSISPSQEHFITHLIKQKLIVAIDRLGFNQPIDAPKFMLFLPSDELHEISLLFAYYIIKARRCKAIYLGQSLPIADLQEAYEVYNPDYIVTSITSPVSGQGGTERYLKLLSGNYPDCKFLVGGIQVVGQDLSLPENVQVMNKIKDLVDEVEYSKGS